MEEAFCDFVAEWAGRDEFVGIVCPFVEGFVVNEERFWHDVMWGIGGFEGFLSSF